jgi:hypothetical protein
MWGYRRHAALHREQSGIDGRRGNSQVKLAFKLPLLFVAVAFYKCRPDSVAGVGTHGCQSSINKCFLLFAQSEESISTSMQTPLQWNPKRSRGISMYDHVQGDFEAVYVVVSTPILHSWHRGLARLAPLLHLAVCTTQVLCSTDLS